MVKLNSLEPIRMVFTALNIFAFIKEFGLEEKLKCRKYGRILKPSARIRNKLKKFLKTNFSPGGCKGTK